MKKSLMFPFLFAALLVLCACTQGTEADAPTANAGITLTLRAAEHPELDFGMAGEQRALMDFAVWTDGLVYLLGQDGQILAYRADGTLAAEYDLALRCCRTVRSGRICRMSRKRSASGWNAR